MTTNRLPPRPQPRDRRVRPPLPIRRFTIKEYHKLIKVGILTTADRVELIDGWIVPKVPQDLPHTETIEWLTMWLVELIDRKRLSVRCQMPIGLVGDNEPEPDLAVVTRAPRRTAQPGCDEIQLLIEVANSSLRQDRTKLQVYAANGIREYWIVNMAGRCIEVYTDPIAGRKPEYCTLVEYSVGDSIPIRVAKDAGIVLPVADIPDFQDTP